MCTHVCVLAPYARQPEFGSDTGDWVTRKSTGDLVITAVFMN